MKIRTKTLRKTIHAITFLLSILVMLLSIGLIVYVTQETQTLRSFAGCGGREPGDPPPRPARPTSTPIPTSLPPTATRIPPTATRVPPTPTNTLTPTPTMIPCYDSDGGDNESEKGFVTKGPGQPRIWDTCTYDDIGEVYIIQERYCSETGSQEIAEHVCPKWCYGGLCMPFPTNTPEPTLTPTPTKTPIPTPTPTKDPAGSYCNTTLLPPIICPKGYICVPSTSTIGSGGGTCQPSTTQPPLSGTPQEFESSYLYFSVQGAPKEQEKLPMFIQIKKGPNSVYSETVECTSDNTKIVKCELPYINPGTYTIIAKGWAHLQRKMEDITVSGFTQEIDLTPSILYAGDVSGDDGEQDNVINALDIGYAMQEWGSKNSDADINKDKKVDGLDVSFILQNYFLKGQ